MMPKEAKVLLEPCLAYSLCVPVRQAFGREHSSIRM
jgi:hypothetical protein